MTSFGRDLSIIIVNWNTRDLLLRCLGAIYETVGAGLLARPRATEDGRPYRLNFEVIVIDNGSEDDSVDALRQAFPQVKVFVNEHNLGYSKAVNQGLAQARGRYLVLLNTDAIVTPGALEEMTKVMDANEDAGLAGGLLLNEDGSAQNSFAAFPALLSELSNKSLLRIIWPGKFASKSRGVEEPFDVDSLIGACLMVRATAAEEVGPLDEDYFFFLEETDWARRMHQAGWRVIHIPRAKIYHLQGRSAAKMPIRARIEFYRSRYTFFRKWYGPARASILKAGLLLRLIVEMFLGFIYSSLTLFLLKKEVFRLRLHARLLIWHLLGTPADWGLKNLSCLTSHDSRSSSVVRRASCAVSKVPISACIITYNEEENIRECLKSIAWLDEIVVVDAFSQDRTVEVCREFTDRVYKKKWPGFKEQKNYALDVASNDWVLSIDADERVSPELAREIKQVLSKCGETISGFYFPRRAHYLGRWISHGGWYPNRKLRLFRKEKGRWVGADLHERVEVQGLTQSLKNDLRHFPYKDIAEHLKTVSNYADIASKEMHSLGKKFRLWQIILHPPIKFLETYLWKCGFMDGTQGLIIALMSSYYVFLKYAKLWEKERISDAHTGH